MQRQMWEVVGNLNDTKEAYRGIYQELSECRRRNEELERNLEGLWEFVRRSNLGGPEGGGGVGINEQGEVTFLGSGSSWLEY